MAATPALFTESYPTLDPVSVFEPIRSGLRNVIQGRDEVIDLILVALLADGHVLLEDHPGSGKTTLARTLGGLIETGVETDLPSFRRIQFTPDLMPSDILGVSSAAARCLLTCCWPTRSIARRLRFRPHCWKRWPKSR
jgi:MoxR-like ATPase